MSLSERSADNILAQASQVFVWKITWQYFGITYLKKKVDKKNIFYKKKCWLLVGSLLRIGRRKNVMPKYYQVIFQANTWLGWAKILSADLSDKDMIADKYLIDDKYFICDIFFIGDMLYLFEPATWKFHQKFK